MTWSFRPALKNFEAARGDWDSLNHSQYDHILLDSGFVAPLLRHFGSGDVLLGTNTSSLRPGMLLVTRKALGIWETFQPSQAPIGLFVAGSRDDASKFFPDILRRLPGPAVQLAILQQDSAFGALSPNLADSQLEAVQFAETAGLTVQGTFEKYWAERNDDLRRNMMRRIRRLEKQGSQLELSTLTEPGDVAEAIREYGRMEAQGWKGRNGTAISEDNDQAHFYRDVMEYFCARGEGYIYRVHLDGRLIGSELYIMRNGMLVGLKTTFDESLRELSPGFLMKYLIIRQVFAEAKANTIEFYGPVKDWHGKWATHVRPLFHFNYFRYRWVRNLRAIVKRVTPGNRTAAVADENVDRSPDKIAPLAAAPASLEKN